MTDSVASQGLRSRAGRKKSKRVMSPVLEGTPALEEGISLLDAESGTFPPSCAPAMDPDLSEGEGVLNSEQETSSSFESEEEKASEENATALLKQLTKVMLVNQKQQRKERKETQKLLKTLVKDMYLDSPS